MSTRSHRVLRRLGLILLILLGVVLIGLAGVLIWLNSPPGRRTVTQRASREVPGLQIGELDGFLPFHPLLRDLRVQVGELPRPLLAVDEVELTWSPLALLSRTLELSVEVREPRVYVAPLPDGRTNLQAWLDELERQRAEEPQREPSRWTFELEQAALDGGHLEYRTVPPADQPPPQLPALEIADLVLRARGQAGPDQTRAELDQLGGRAALFRSPEQGSIPFRFEASGQVLVADKVEGNLRARLLELAPGEPVELWARAEGPRSRVLLAGGVQLPAEGQAELAGWLSLPQDSRPLAYELALGFERIDPGAVLASLPRGSLGGHLSLQGQGTPPDPGSRAEGIFVLYRSTLAGRVIDGLQLQAHQEGETWQVPLLEARTFNAVLHGQGAGAGSRLLATLQLEAPGTEAVLASGQQLSLAGSAALRLEGDLAADLVATLDAALRELTSGRAEVRNAQLQARLIRRPGSPEGRAELKVERIALQERPLLEQVHGELELTGDLLTAQLDAPPATRGKREPPPLLLRAALPLRAADGGAGRVPDRQRPVLVELTWNKVPLEVLAGLLELKQRTSGYLDLVARLGGTLEQPEAEARLALDQARYGRLDRMKGTLELTSREQLTSLQARVARRGRELLQLKANMAAGPEALLRPASLRQEPFEARLLLPRQPVAPLGSLVPALRSWRGTVELAAEAEGTFRAFQTRLSTDQRQAGVGSLKLGHLETLSRLTAGEQETTLESRATLQRRRILNVSLALGQPWTELLREGGADEAPLELAARIPRLPLTLFSKQNPDLAPARGTLEGKLGARGTLADPRGSGWLRLDRAQLAGQPFGQARLTATRGAQQLLARLRFDQEGGGELRARASLGRDRSLAARAELDGLQPGPLQLLIPELEQVIGPIYGVATLSGHIGLTPPARAAASEAEHPMPRLPPSRPVVLRRLDLDRARLVLRWPEAHEEQPKKKQRPQVVTQLDEQLRSALPLHLVRAQLRNSEVTWLDLSEQEVPVLKLHQIEASLDNFATRDDLMRGAPTVFAARAVLEQQGQLTAFATGDPLADKITVAGQAELKDLQLTSLSDWLSAKLGLEAAQGSLDMFTSFQVRQGEVKGGVKILLENAEIEASEPTLVGWIGKLLADVTLFIFSNAVPARDTAGTIVPIRGTLANPSVQVVPAFLGLLRNAFVVGLSASFANLPPVAAETRQGLLSQILEALSRKQAPSRAQPAPDRERPAGEREQPGP